MKVQVVTVSDRATAGAYSDTTGPAIVQLLTDRLPTVDVAGPTVIPDKRDQIVTTLRTIIDDGDVDVVVTNGGTGLTERDVTPEAIIEVADRLVPGMAEAMRAAGRTNTPMADLSRQVVGQYRKSLIVAVPGSPKAAVESLEAVLPLLPHAVEMVRS